jgi:predicted phosphodiesterase
MRVLYFSDIHVEVREQGRPAPWTPTLPLGFGPDLSACAGGVELLVLAGDIGRMQSRRNVSPLAYAEQAAAFLGCRVVLVPGNHEYYRGSFDEDRAAMLAARRPRVCVLDRGEVFLASGSSRLRVLGATLWTDYAVTGDTDAAMEIATRDFVDHSLIRRAAGSRPFMPADALDEHRLSRAWLAGRLAQSHDGPTVIVTHHVPHPAAAHPDRGLDELASAFCSDRSDLIAAAASAGAKVWIFGHHHWSHTIEVCGVPLLSAQPGYPGEATGWSGPGRLEL